jgi:signal transduction histidine kinase
VLQDPEGAAANAGVRIEAIDLPPCDLACSPGVLSSIILNLVQNAIKHMSPGRARREVRIVAKVESSHAHIEVADTGAGLPAEMRERVFEPYVRLDPSRPGLGLGLATVRRLVVAHGGVVWVGAGAEGGSVFWFDLPLRSERPRDARRFARPAADC